MANKKKTYDLSINGVQQSIKDTTILKQSISALDKSIITAKFPSKLTESFRSFSDFSKSFSKETNYMEEAITKVVPTLNTASQKINAITRPLEFAIPSFYKHCYKRCFFIYPTLNLT